MTVRHFWKCVLSSFWFVTWARLLEALHFGVLIHKLMFSPVFTMKLAASHFSLPVTLILLLSLFLYFPLHPFLYLFFLIYLLYDIFSSSILLPMVFQFSSFLFSTWRVVKLTGRARQVRKEKKCSAVGEDNIVCVGGWWVWERACAHVHVYPLSWLRGSDEPGIRNVSYIAVYCSLFFFFFWLEILFVL